MLPSSASNDVFRVRRWRLHHAQPAGVANSVPARVEQVLRRELPSILASHDFSGQPDRRVVFIRHLILNFDLNAEWDDRQIAAVLGASLTRALTRALREAADHANVVVFESPAAYLASYLAARAGALSGRDWLFAEFEGLHVATASIAIRTLAARDPPMWLEAMGTLGPQPRRQVLAALDANDARRILECLAKSGVRSTSASVDVALAARLVARLRREAGVWDAPSRDGVPGVILTTLARLIRLAADEIGGPIAFLTRTTLAFTILEPEAWPTSRAPIAKSPTITETAALTEGYGDTLAACIQPLLEPRVRSILTAPQNDAAARRTDPDELEDDAPSSQFGKPTRFGGAFLLLPFLPDEPFGAEPPLDGDGSATPAALARFVVLRFCHGPRGFEFAHDALWRDLCGIPPDLSERRLTRWLEQPFDVAPWAHALRAALMKRHMCSGETPTAVHLPLDDRRVVVSLDLETGYWFSLSIDDAADTLGDPASPPASPEHIDRLRRDVEYLARAFGPAFRTPRPAALAVVAHNVLRTFAARLRGFRTASLPHLQANFLNVAGALSETERGLEAALRPPPLHVVLSMSSILNRPHRLAWLGGRSITLSLDPS